MKLNKSILIATSLLFGSNVLLAGNEDRVGSAGASELLINPWARSSAWGDAGMSSVNGLEAAFVNVAGLAFTDKTELIFNRTNWLQSTGIKMNSMGFAQRTGDVSVIALTFTTMNFGDVMITTTDKPEGGVGTFSPRYYNLGFSYAREFSNSIYGGLTVRAISEQINNAKASGIAFDAGIRYVTGEKDNIKFGIALKNVGPTMAFEGDGFSVTSIIQATNLSTTTEQRSAKFELPSLVSIGFSYDFLISEAHKLTAAGTYTSNSFSKDNFRLGLEYSFSSKKATFIARGGYVQEKGIFSADTRTSALTGPTGGISVDMKAGEKGTNIGFDYTYRATNPFNGVHSIGVRINLK
jgi:hypothetical protein